MTTETKKVSVSFPILGLLGIAFVVLKLTGHIDWSWWFVTLPFWIGPAIALGFLAVFGVMFVLGAILDSRR